MSQYLFESDHLRFRELNKEDISELFYILSDDETMKFYPRPYNYNETKDWINGAIKSYRNDKFGLWAVILTEEDKFIGQCGIAYRNIDGERVPEIGYHINKDYWNHGFATEASKLFLEKGFSTFGLSEIFIHTWIKNIPSIKVAEKIGMFKRKEFDKKTSYAQMVMRHVVYSITENEFNKND